MKDNIVNIVSLGPGDHSLITERGKSVLLASEFVFCPKTKSGSRAKDMLMLLGVEEQKICTYELPMSKDRSKALAVYGQVADKIVELHQKGKYVSLVAEGDSGFYSSTSYIQKKLQERKIEVKQTVGIPAFIAAATSIGINIIEQEEQLIVSPGFIDERDIEKTKEGKAVMVVMKISQCEEEIKQMIEREKGLMFYYIENATTEKEYYTSCEKEIVSRSFPYFSMMIIKKKKQ